MPADPTPDPAAFLSTMEAAGRGAALHAYEKTDLARLCDLAGASNSVLRELLTGGDGLEKDVVPEIVRGLVTWARMVLAEKAGVP